MVGGFTLGAWPRLEASARSAMVMLGSAANDWRHTYTLD